MSSREHLVRALWTLFEPVHALTYFSPQSRDSFAAAGLTRYWDGYFAGRAAPLGAISGAPVTAIFSGFAPALVERALPAVWSTLTPERALEARAEGAVATIRALAPDESIVARAAEALLPAALAVGAHAVGRPLAAANHALLAALVTPDPYRVLWQCVTTLREHRGDGHVLALVTEDMAGLSTIVLRAGLDLDAPHMQRARGWTDDEWHAEQRSLVARGLLAPAASRTDAGTSPATAPHAATPLGEAALARAEQLTNTLAVGPWQLFDDNALRAIAAALYPVAAACAPLFPYPNPIGMPHSWNPTTDPDATAVPSAPERGAARTAA
ncbi:MULTISPECIES: SCO6745 family protein [Subtercola]|uniref:SCO6745 family protein n=1 Tax=Subtercola TaxID=120212 RepID=UPI00191D5740|nr:MULTISPECIES: hypothetical protein [Subtercola]MEA9984386.1 hypothetical protein [Subtercola sp. RTI3]